MKTYRYLKVTGDLIWGEHELTIDMLIAVKNHQYDTIIDLENMRYYDAETNEWKEVEGSE